MSKKQLFPCVCIYMCRVSVVCLCDCVWSMCGCLHLYVCVRLCVYVTASVCLCMCVCVCVHGYMCYVSGEVLTFHLSETAFPLALHIVCQVSWTHALQETSCLCLPSCCRLQKHPN